MRIDIDHIAKLAHLRIDQTEKDKFTQQMEALLDLVGALPPSEGEMKDVDPQNPMVLRPDVIMPSTPRTELLKNAPQTQAGCVVVPKVVEG